MAAIIAVIIIGVISFISVNVRCYTCTSMILIGLPMALAGMDGGIFLALGLSLMLGGVGIIFLTSLSVEPSRRIYYMGNLFLAGLFMFLKVFLFLMILTAPFAMLVAGIGNSYKEAVILDSSGYVVGRDYIDSYGRNPDGTQYEQIDDDKY